MYKSPLEPVHTYCAAHLPYRGTLGSVLGGLSRLTSKAILGDRLYDGDAARFLLHPGRVVRGAIEYNIAVDGDAEECVTKSLDFAVNMARLRFSEADLPQLRDMFARYAGALDTPVVESKDDWGWECTSPRFSRRTAKRIFKSPLRNGKDVLLIVGAHGGVRAGIDVLNFYRSVAGRPDAAVLDVLRFSKYDKKMSAPFLSAEAKDRLHAAARGRTVVMFDENLCSGGTAIDILNYLSTEVFPHQPVYFEANYKAEVFLQYE